MAIGMFDLIKTFQHLNCCAFIKDKKGYYTFINDAACVAFNKPREDIIGQCDDDFLDPSISLEIKKNDLIALQGNPVTRIETYFINDGDSKHYQTIKSAMYDKHGEIIGLVGLAIDIDDTIRKHDKLEYIAMHDAVTDLYNRRFLDSQLNAQVAWHTKRNKPLSLIMLDIDNFKTINDYHGHEIGDTTLIKVSKLIKQSVREDDVCCRYGGDEFMILLPLTKQGPAFLLAERIRQLVFTYPFTGKDNIPFNVSVSLGIGGLSAGIDDKSLKRHADQALFCAKKHNKNSCLVHCANKGKIVSCDKEKCFEFYLN
jgi:diguanylate cyclase (GGDEF)-like protein